MSPAVRVTLMLTGTFFISYLPISADTTASNASGMRTVVFKGSAPGGARVSLDSVSTLADSAGHWRLSVSLDSLTRQAGTLDLCLEQNEKKACVPVHPAGYDTLELAPLHFTETVRIVTDTLRAGRDSAAIDSITREEEKRAVRLDQKRAAKSRTVVVVGHHRPKALGQDQVTVQEIKRLPGLAEPDVIRAVQALPGVVSSSDFSTKIYVRGSASDQNLVLFDNAVVYSPSHFGGLFSTFLADAVGGLDFYKGGFDPLWGNRLASVLSVHSKDGGSTYDSSQNRLAGTWLGDSAKEEGSVRLTTFSGTAETDGRKGDWSWALAGRRTWIDQALNAANALNITDFNLSYFFYDWQGNLAWGDQYDTVRVSAYQGRDKLDLSPLSVDWGNGDFPLNVHKRITPYLSYDGTLAWSSFDQSFGVSDFLELYNSIQTLNTRDDFTYTGFPGHTLTAGYEFNSFAVNFIQNEKFLNQYLQDKYQADLHAGFLQDRWVLNPRHTVTYGLRAYDYTEPHASGSGLLNRFANLGLDPRFTYTYRPGRDWRYDFHMGYYHQYLTSLSFSGQETPNEFWYAIRGSMKPSTNTLTSFGVERDNLTPLGLTASWEGYYKDIRNIPLFAPSDSAPSATSNISNFFLPLDGYALGSEFTLKREQGALSGSLSYAYSVSVLQQSAYSNGVAAESTQTYYADWDQRNTIKLTGNINWTGRARDALFASSRKGRYFRTNLQLNYHTGLPYTGLGLYSVSHDAFQNASASDSSLGTGRIRADNDARNDLNRPYYLRLDVTPIDIGVEGKWRFYWTFINLFNRKNVYLVQIERNQNPPTKSYVYQFPFLPIFLGYEYEF